MRFRRRHQTVARIVLVHDDTEFADAAAVGLVQAGHAVTTYADPGLAWDALAPGVDVLITRVFFAAGHPHGVALASRARLQQIKVVFCGLPEYANLCVGLGTFLKMPVAIPDLVAVVQMTILSS